VRGACYTFFVANRTIVPARRILGAVSLPGDKSISHRYAVLAAIAAGPTEIENFSTAADCASTLECLERLGVEARRTENKVRIQGPGFRSLRQGWRRPDAGNSGTTMRLLAGILAGQKSQFTITGDHSLRRRPMRRVLEPLRQMGARIRAREDQFAPLKIEGGELHSISYPMAIASAQVKSAVLLAGLFAEGETSVTEPVGTRDHTELALAEFGAGVARANSTVRVTGRPRLAGRPLAVPGDLSSAVFLIAAACVLPEANLLLSGVGLNPTRAAVLDLLKAWGASLRLVKVESRHGELHGDILVRAARLSGGVVSGHDTARMIDELPMLAALGPYTEQGIEIRDAAELHVKESDRIAALAANLRRMGAGVEEFADGLRVAPAGETGLRGGAIDPQGDHRIAMAMAIAALGAKGDSVISDPACAAVSFPGFFEILDRIIER